MKTYIPALFAGFGLLLSSLKADDYQLVDSHEQIERVIKIDGSMTVILWDIFETPIRVEDRIFQFSIHERGGAEFAKGVLDLERDTCKLKTAFREIPNNTYEVQEITVRDDGSKILRLKFEFGILPKGATLHIKAI